MKLSIVILAAGHGKRMNSSLPKIMHPLAGVPMIERIINTANSLQPEQTIVVYGPNLNPLLPELARFNVQWALQAEQLGTGHAVMQAMSYIPEDHQVLVLYGDVPLITASSLDKLIAKLNGAKVALLVTQREDPYGFGRIIRDEAGHIIKIIEQKDATQEQSKIQEINTGIITAPAKQLKKWLPALQNNNAQQEYYLTDIIAKAVDEGVAIQGIAAAYQEEVQGVNNLYQLGKLERFYQFQQAERLMREGVMIMDPTRFDLRGELQAGHDVIIDINVVFEGTVILGNNCRIEPNVILRNVRIGDHVTIKANCVIEDSVVDDHCSIGPFARIRPDTHLHTHVHIGNFVETKKSEIGQGSKAGHLSYLGDATIGKNVNVGAGTITCNYNGAQKCQTAIDDNSFIGSGTQLVAPVRIGNSAYIGAGSTITQDAPANKLTIARQRQTTIENWQPPKKETEHSS